MRAESIPLLVVVWLLCLCGTAAGGVIVKYDFAGQPGDQAQTPVASKDLHVTASLTRGAGITPAPYGSSFSSTNWSPSSSVDTSQNDYYEFSVQSAPGYAMTLTSVSFGTGSQGFARIWSEFREGPNYSTPGLSVSVGADASFDFLLGTSPVTSYGFRLYGYNASPATGLFCLRNNSTTGGLVLEGTVDRVVRTLVWSGAEDGAWTDPTWSGSPPTVPDNTVDAVINTPHTVRVESIESAFSVTTSNGGQLLVKPVGALDVVGAISGTGRTTVHGRLTAASIVQDTLSIGAGGSVVIREATGAGAGVNAVPEPAVWTLLIAAGACLLPVVRRRALLRRSPSPS
jgi:hypothetical protein